MPEVVKVVVSHFELSTFTVKLNSVHKEKGGRVNGKIFLIEFEQQFSTLGFRIIAGREWINPLINYWVQREVISFVNKDTLLKLNYSCFTRVSNFKSKVPNCCLVACWISCCNCECVDSSIET